jgi:hypothetical protein
MTYFFRLKICLLFFGCLWSGCGEKKDKVPKEKFFPVLSFLKSQVKDIDTSLYAIKKLIPLDSLHTDTVYIPREKFREEAHDFLSIPDLALPEYANRYKEEKQMDETLGRVMLIYTPINPEKEIIQRQAVWIKQDPSEDKITNIIINSVVNSKDSLVEKEMLWKVGESFLVRATRQLPGQPETNSTVKVVWNESE